MLEIESAGLAREAYKRRREWLLMEVLVPGLAQVAGRGPALADAGRRAVEEKQAGEPLRVFARERLHHIGADIMADEPNAIEPERVEQAADILCVHLGTRVVGRIGVGLIRAPEAAQVGRDQVKAIAQPRHGAHPHAREFRPAVQQHEWRPRAVAQVMHADAVDAEFMRAGLVGGHAAFPYGIIQKDRHGCRSE